MLSNSRCGLPGLDITKALIRLRLRPPTRPYGRRLISRPGPTVLRKLASTDTQRPDNDVPGRGQQDTYRRFTAAMAHHKGPVLSEEAFTYMNNMINRGREVTNPSTTELQADVDDVVLRDKDAKEAQFSSPNSLISIGQSEQETFLRRHEADYRRRSALLGQGPAPLNRIRDPSTVHGAARRTSPNKLHDPAYRAEMFRQWPGPRGLRPGKYKYGKLRRTLELSEEMCTPMPFDPATWETARRARLRGQVHIGPELRAKIILTRNQPVTSTLNPSKKPASEGHLSSKDIPEQPASTKPRSQQDSASPLLSKSRESLEGGTLVSQLAQPSEVNSISAKSSPSESSENPTKSVRLFRTCDLFGTAPFETSPPKYHSSEREPDRAERSSSRTSSRQEVLSDLGLIPTHSLPPENAQGRPEPVKALLAKHHAPETSVHVAPIRLQRAVSPVSKQRTPPSKDNTVKLDCDPSDLLSLFRKYNINMRLSSLAEKNLHRVEKPATQERPSLPQDNKVEFENAPSKLPFLEYHPTEPSPNYIAEQFSQWPEQPTAREEMSSPGDTDTEPNEDSANMLVRRYYMPETPSNVRTGGFPVAKESIRCKAKGRATMQGQRR